MASAKVHHLRRRLRAAVLSCVSLIYAYELTPGGVEYVIGFGAANDFALAYLAGAAVLVGLHAHEKHSMNGLGGLLPPLSSHNSPSDPPPSPPSALRQASRAR